ncbi:MAG TPA: cupredoxin domain-containing protein [Actinomycetota bacterium]
MGRTRSITAILAVAAVVALTAAACGGGSPKTKSGGAGTAVGVTVKDFAIAAGNPSVAAGAVTFSIKNAGPSVHEFVILKTDALPAKLPTKFEDGAPAADEEGAGVEHVDEVEDIAAGATASLSVRLTPGKYVFICNLPGHYHLGMNTGFVVR